MQIIRPGHCRVSTHQIANAPCAIPHVQGYGCDRQFRAEEWPSRPRPIQGFAAADPVRSTVRCGTAFYSYILNQSRRRRLRHWVSSAKAVSSTRNTCAHPGTLRQGLTVARTHVRSRISEIKRDRESERESESISLRFVQGPESSTRCPVESAGCNPEDS